MIAGLMIYDCGSLQLDRQQQGMIRQSESIAEWKKKYQAMTDRLREIPLTDVACELGFDPDPKDSQKWRKDDLRLNLTESKFYDWQAMKGGGGALDLVMHIERCNFSDAVSWLRDRFGDAKTIETVAKQTERLIEERPRQPFQPPQPSEENWQHVRSYLTQTRKLPSAIVDALHKSGAVYADEHQNVVFLRRSVQGDVTGAALRGTVGQSNAFKGLAAGSRRMEGWFMLESPQSGEVQHAIVCESAIDALSYAVLHPAQQKTLYLSTDGSGSVPLERLRQIPQVTLAVDRDEAGEAMAQRIGQELLESDRQVPTAKDWNEDLQSHLSQVQRQFEQKNRLPGRNRNLGYER